MIIHKTMRMPTSCTMCWISNTCDVWTSETRKHNGYDKRLEDCPLEEVKTGRWKDYPIADGCIQCSACGVLRMGEPSNYCPTCGAKMEVEHE